MFSIRVWHTYIFYVYNIISPPFRSFQKYPCDVSISRKEYFKFKCVCLTDSVPLFFVDETSLTNAPVSPASEVSLHNGTFFAQLHYDYTFLRQTLENFNEIIVVNVHQHSASNCCKFTYPSLGIISLRWQTLLSGGLSSDPFRGSFQKPSRLFLLLVLFFSGFILLMPPVLWLSSF